MRLVPCFLLAFGFARAQYFSEGWTPGQAVPTETVEAETITGTPTSTATPAAKWSWQEFSSKHLDFGKFVTEGPIATALSGIGFNATEQLELARQRALERGWDERIPLLTDSNYETLVKNETFDTPEAAEKRTWFVVVTIGKQDTMSKYVDENTLDGPESTILPRRRLQPIGWPPTLIVIKDNGNTLRFYQPGQIVLDSAMLYKFVALDGWKETEPWSGPWAPGGSRQPYLHAYAVLSRRAYNIISALPRWVILLVTGAIGSFIINFFHKDSGRPKPVRWNQKQQTPAQPAKQSSAEKTKANSGQTQTTAVAPSPSSATKRQAKKKA
ncbi:unnamed protein product [Rhizoctonia solani]|uniref:Uncharacterized protein n=1 Tax=Rhizoctonia solani TaxID=456999 RepID=A0A8H2XQ93_9AGAM|nr:unnamed protein product [Rhizoctonia solani]